MVPGLLLLEHCTRRLDRLRPRCGRKENILQPRNLWAGINPGNDEDLIRNLSGHVAEA